MTDVLLGIDAGTSNIKTVAFTPDGKECGHSSRKNPVKRPHPNWAEQDMQQTWQRTAATLRDVTDTLATDDEIVGVGVTGQGGGCWLVDSDGEPVRNAILWSDGRATDRIEAWRECGVYDEVFNRCGYGLFPGGALPLLRWIRANEPDRLERARTLITCKDWIKYQLTGELGSDPSDMSLVHYSPVDDEYVDEIPDMVGLPELPGLAPPIETPTEVIGTVTESASSRTGITEGTPVISGLMDVAASAFGSGAVEPRHCSTLVGTTLQNQIIQSEPTIEPPKVGYTLALGIDGKGLRAMGAMTGTPNLDWFLNEIVGSRDFEALESELRNLPVGCDGLLYHPFLSTSGEKAPFLKPTARAQFTGLSPTHTQDHLLRAIYEGIALAMRDCYDHIPQTPTETYVSGGGAQSPFWCQMFADCLGVDVVVPQGRELGARGIALLAGIACGKYTNTDAAIAKMTATAEAYSPRQPQASQFDRLYELYTATYEAMFDVWETRAQIINESD